MKKLFALALSTLIASSVLAAPAQQVSPQVWGWMAGVGIENGGATGDTLNSATGWLERGFRLNEAKTLSAVRLYCSADTGAPNAVHFKLRAANTTAGGPNTSTDIEDKTLAEPTCPTWMEAGSYSTALSAGTQYFIVVNNATGTPASNHVTLNSFSRMGFPWAAGGANGNGSAQFGWTRGTSSDSGGTWAAGNARGGVLGGFRLEFSDGTFAGFPAQTMAKNSTEQVYDTREAGPQFLYPAGQPTARVAGIAMPMNWSGTAPTTFYYRLRSGTGCDTLIDTTASANDEDVEINGWIPLYFSSVQLVQANTTYCVTVGTPTGAGDGSSGNAWNIEAFTWDTDSDSVAMLPYSLKTAYYDGSSWTTTQARVSPFALLLDTGSSGPYSVGASGSYSRGASGNLQ